LADLDGFDRRPVAVVVTADGRRVHVPVENHTVGHSLVELFRLLLIGLEDVLELITGSRREDGRSRRNGRR